MWCDVMWRTAPLNVSMGPCRRVAQMGYRPLAGNWGEGVICTLLFGLPPPGNAVMGQLEWDRPAESGWALGSLRTERAPQRASSFALGIRRVAPLRCGGCGCVNPPSLQRTVIAGAVHPVVCLSRLHHAAGYAEGAILTDPEPEYLLAGVPPKRRAIPPSMAVGAFQAPTLAASALRRQRPPPRAPGGG